jgi:hypothetical protein
VSQEDTRNGPILPAGLRIRMILLYVQRMLFGSLKRCLFTAGAALLVAAYAGLLVFTTSHANDAPTCTNTTLSSSIVNTVNAAAKQSGITSTDYKTLMTRNLGEGWQAQAYVAFLPDSCGFIANIQDEPVSSQAADEPQPANAARDVFRQLRDGRPFDPGFTSCLSNTMPIVRMVGGPTDRHLVLTIICSRVVSNQSD